MNVMLLQKLEGRRKWLVFIQECMVEKRMNGYWI